MLLAGNQEKPRNKLLVFSGEKEDERQEYYENRKPGI